jgi:peptidoglycan/xylan/chitin deacetylase (PgdA/CDA1 family)
MKKILTHWYHHSDTEICDLEGMKEEEIEKLKDYLESAFDGYTHGIYSIQEEE